MVELDWETERTDGVTLVRLYVTAEYRRRVRVASRLDGPVWPPRREGQPAAGWDGDAFEGVVTPDERLVAGFATPAPPEDPPAEVVSEQPADPDAPPGPVGECVDPATDGRLAAADGGESADASGGASAASGRAGERSRTRNGDGSRGASSDGKLTSEEVVRSLGDPVVPREAVPVPDAAEDGETGHASPAKGEGDDRDGKGDEDGEGRGERADDGPAEGSGRDDGTGHQQVTREAGAAGPRRSPEGAVPPGTDAELVVPGAVRAWLRDVDRRVRAVERRREVERADPDPTLQVAVAADRRALARVADRVETLVGRTTAVERRAGGDGRR